MGLLNSILKRQSGADIRQNGSAPTMDDKTDHAARLGRAMVKLIALVAEELRQRQEVSESEAETEPDKKTN
jgi:hypothetical protein